MGAIASTEGPIKNWKFFLLVHFKSLILTLVHKEFSAHIGINPLGIFDFGTNLHKKGGEYLGFFIFYVHTL